MQARPIGLHGSGWKDVMLDNEDVDDNQTSASYNQTSYNETSPPHATVSDEDTQDTPGSTSTPNTSMDVLPNTSISTSMDNIPTVDLSFDIYGLRFHSVGGNPSVVHCLWDDTETSHVELHEAHPINEVLYFSADISVETKHFKDKMCFHNVSVDNYIDDLFHFTEVIVSQFDKGKIAVHMGE